MKMEQESIAMEVVNPQAAGIDVGSRSHWVAVGQSEKDVCEFGVFSQDLFALADWLKQSNVKTVAMESTGTYWQNLYAVLISRGFQVVLCNGKFTKNIKGKKTDIKDCQWIQKLHTLGLLTSSFLPDGKTEELRTYCRQRANLLHSAASTSKKMQKNLRLLNLRLDVVVKDVCGLTGLLIIRAVCDGGTNPEELASLRHGNCRKSEEEIAKALQSNGRKDYLFALQQELDTYDHLQKKIEECDKEIEKMLDEIINSDDNKRQHHIAPKPHKRINKKHPQEH
jgi:transposase